MDIKSILKSISEQYPFKGKIIGFSQCVNGHINETYRVTIGGEDSNSAGLTQENENTHEIKSTGNSEYIFQKINRYVFKDPAKVMHNIKEITLHINSKKTQSDCGIISFINNNNGSNYTVFNGDYWRVCRFVENSVAFETAEEPKVLRSAGYAFGRFQYMLSDFPMDRLYETIPDFHNTKKRLDYFFDILAQDPVGRAKMVKDEIKFFEKNREMASKLINMHENGEIPLRVTHNDTKYNNILMDKDTLKPLCVIDLDTVMPGLAMYDFGDAIRFAANSAPEDETNLDLVNLDMVKYEEFTKGFIEASGALLTKNELDNMALGAITITIELASRFLADYLNGDKYFRIHRENHNLDRARCQIKLAEDMMSNYDKMCEYVK